ncbi:hypothetical protein CBR_g24393 [Chara braunii]|uniref:Serine decarboxylase n=1 Tax=Chara braunii TaxID=69332 RepID=A0A388JMM4_CHABU|nr:hypothetical protein CBR_g24393 [Chara braunii]|eukprot:GBG59047.1 hypothetical protein CBR_g24393 [Chara braunii]
MAAMEVERVRCATTGYAGEEEALPLPRELSVEDLQKDVLLSLLPENGSSPKILDLLTAADKREENGVAGGWRRKGEGEGEGGKGQGEAEVCDGAKPQSIAGARTDNNSRRSMRCRSLPITEPEAEDEYTGEKEAYMAAVLARFRHTLEERTRNHLGYPYNLEFEYGALTQLQCFSINNLGDPFIESNYGVHSRQFEVGVLDWFARLWELEKDEYWGYITNCGTEGNLHGILVGLSLQQGLAGTTVKGAVDDLDCVIATLERCGYPRDRFYIHCDGALFGLMIPFVKKAAKVTFKKPIDSVSVSGHKFVGCPMPCGIQMTRMCHIERLSRNVEYLASRDATIMGSRNGHAPIYLWYTLNRKGYQGFKKEVADCLKNAQFLYLRLREAKFGAMLNSLSSTVVFERPQEEAFVRKWQLACQGKIAHVVVMPSVKVNKLEAFVRELLASRKKFFPDGVVVPPCIADELGADNCECPDCHVA